LNFLIRFWATNAENEEQPEKTTGKPATAKVVRHYRTPFQHIYDEREPGEISDSSMSNGSF